MFRRDGDMIAAAARALAAAAAVAFAAAAHGARVDVLPQCFNAGGWALDVQFMDVMGSPYLIAHGAGQRVLDATARANVPEAGEWRVWVRTRRWTDGAGEFALSVGGRRVWDSRGVTRAEWGWDGGCAVALEKGDVEIRLTDLDGFDGRCAGVVLTKGGDAPSGPLSPAALPVAEVVNADFVVVGGGIPGVCAALAAARRGLKVALVQDRPVLGGNGSNEIRVWSGGEARYPLVREVRGWFMNRDGNHALSDASRMRIVADEPNILLHLCTRAFGAVKNGDAIAGVKALDWRANRVVEFRAPLFCDATGDGWLGVWAGADWRMGREAKSEHGEASAPDKADGDTLGASIMWTSVNANTDVPFSAPWAERHACGIAAVNGEWNWEYGIHQDMIEDGERIRDRLFLAIYGAFSLAKRKPGNSRRVINFMPFLIGKRESRRIMGDWVLNENDFVQRRKFEDAVASTSWSIDLHYDDAKKGVDFLTTCRSPHYGRNWIPYRSIYSRNVQNLFMAGRCFSCTHVGLGSPRVINTLAQLGVAAGEAAAMCRERGCLPRGIWKGGHVRELQRRLGGDFPGNPDPAFAKWRVVDDEMPQVKFEGAWASRRCGNGEQYGDFARVPKKGAGDAVYPLPVEKPGRYALMGRVPYDWNIGARNRTEFTLVSGAVEKKFSADMTVKCGEWRSLGEFELVPGATLRLHPGKSVGTVVADAFAIVPAE